MTDVKKWLLSREGVSWCRRTFRDVTDCHSIIELITDCPEGCVHYDAGKPMTAGQVFDHLRTDPIWADLEWDPNLSPDRV
jgi:hypothetical protein